MYEFKIGICATEHDNFVKENPLCNLLQSSAWAQVKDNWRSEIIGVYDEGVLVASALVLIRPLPMHFTMLYTPRGPVMDYNNAELVRFFMLNLKKYGKKQHALFIKLDPPIHYKDFQLGEEQTSHASADTIIQHLKESGAIHQGLTMDMKETIQPRFQANIYCENFTDEKLPKNTKKMMKIAEKKGVTIRLGQEEVVDDFAKIIQLTTERQHISLRNSDYFKKLLTIYPESAFIMLAEVNLKERYEETKKRYEVNQMELAKLKENQVKKRHNLEELETSLTREIGELEESMAYSGDTAVIAGALAVTFGSTSEILYAGMDEKYKRYMPAYLTWYYAISECFVRGCKTCNMGGLEGSLNDGLIKFKANFNPTINEFIGEFDLPVNRLLLKASEYAYKMKKQKK